MRFAIPLLMVAVTVAGCAAISHTKLAPDAAGVPAYAGPVCFLKSPLPTNVPHQALGQIKGGKKTYGSFGEVYAVMATEARRVGGNAVIGLISRTDMNAFAWARPVAQGTVVKIEDINSFDCLKYGGTLN